MRKKPRKHVIATLKRRCWRMSKTPSFTKPIMVLTRSWNMLETTKFFFLTLMKKNSQ